MPETFVSELKRVFIAEEFDKGFEYYEYHKKAIQASFELGLEVVNTLIDFSRFEQANHLLNILIKKHGTFPGGHLAKAKLFRFQRKFEEAEKELTLEIDYFPKTVSYMLEIIAFYYQLGKIDKCMIYYPEVDDMLPGSMESKIVLSYLLIGCSE